MLIITWKRHGSNECRDHISLGEQVQDELLEALQVLFDKTVKTQRQDELCFES